MISPRGTLACRTGGPASGYKVVATTRVANVMEPEVMDCLAFPSREKQIMIQAMPSMGEREVWEDQKTCGNESNVKTKSRFK